MLSDTQKTSESSLAASRLSSVELLLGWWDLSAAEVLICNLRTIDVRVNRDDSS
jgi:hypothetical protein